MAGPYLFTFTDAMETLVDFARGYGKSASLQQMSSAIRSAYREITAAHDWSFLEVDTRIILQAPQTTGTIAYTSSSRTVTLTGATWPDWAIDAQIRFDDTVHDVESVTDTTNLVLDATRCPPTDVAALTTYSIRPRWYVLPPDFISMTPPQEEALAYRFGQHISPSEMLSRSRYFSDTGDPRYYAIGPAPGIYGQMALFLDPPSDSQETLDLTYKRRQRDLKLTGYATAETTGTISSVAGTTTITASGTNFLDTHEGSIIRWGTASARPTSIEGPDPYVEQHSILSNSSTSVHVTDSATGATINGVKYAISDPIDLDIAAYDAFLRCAEKHLAKKMNFKERREIEFDAREALFAAKGADNRTHELTIAGKPATRNVRLADSSDREVVP